MLICSAIPPFLARPPAHHLGLLSRTCMGIDKPAVLSPWIVGPIFFAAPRKRLQHKAVTGPLSSQISYVASGEFYTVSQSCDPRVTFSPRTE